jgi:hypothetical protein
MSMKAIPSASEVTPTRMINTQRFTPIPGISHRASLLSVREILFIQVSLFFIAKL